MMGWEKLGSDSGESKVGMIKRALSALQWIWDCLGVKGGMGFNVPQLSAGGHFKAISIQ